MAIVTMRQLLEAGIHFGHQTRRWHPKMSRYIFGQRNGIYIIDLQHTLRQLYKAYAIVRDEVTHGGSVLFVGTKNQAREAVEREATRCGMFYVNNRWLGGTLTNWQTMRGSIQELKRLDELEESGKIEQFGKKEAGQLRKRRDKLQANLAGIREMPRLPQVLFVIDAKRESIAVREAKRLGIPCVGIVDTNCDPDVVDIPVPGNDDAIRALNLFCSVIADAALEGRMRGEKVRAEEDQKREERKRHAMLEAEQGETGAVEAAEAAPAATTAEAPASDATPAPDAAEEARVGSD